METLLFEAMPYGKNCTIMSYGKNYGTNRATLKQIATEIFKKTN